MRFFSSVIFVLALLACTVSAETVISGNIAGITFDVAKNPYVVEKDIIVPKGANVTIPDGIVFLFHPFTGFQVFGRVAVQGSDTRMVVFTSLNDNVFNAKADQLPNPFDWNGVYISKDAEGAFLNNFALKYSVYGIKSQCQNIIIQNAVFQQNGQFNFTVNEQIKLVVEGMPFSYPDSVGAAGGSKPQDKPKVDKPKVAKPKSEKTKIGVNIFRYSSLGVGVAGGVLAAVYGVKREDNAQKIIVNAADVNKGLPQTWPNDAKLRSDAEKYETTAKVSGILGGVGIICFGVSFFF